MKVFNFNGHFAKYFNQLNDWSCKVIGDKDISGIKYYIQIISCFGNTNIAKTIRQILKCYWKQDSHWKETTYTIDVPADTIPNELIRKAMNSGNNIVDITNEYQQALKV